MTIGCLLNCTPSFGVRIVDNKLHLFNEFKRNSKSSLILTCDIFKFRVAQNYAHSFKYVTNCFRVPLVQELKIISSTFLFKESTLHRPSRLASSSTFS